MKSHTHSIIIHWGHSTINAKQLGQYVFNSFNCFYWLLLAFVGCLGNFTGFQWYFWEFKSIQNKILLFNVNFYSDSCFFEHWLGFLLYMPCFRLCSSLKHLKTLKIPFKMSTFVVKNAWRLAPRSRVWIKEANCRHYFAFNFWLSTHTLRWLPIFAHPTQMKCLLCIVIVYFFCMYSVKAFVFLLEAFIVSLMEFWFLVAFTNQPFKGFLRIINIFILT